MKGTILGFDGTTGAINAEGERYSFTLADWKGDRPPQAKDNVDFVAKDGAATEIYLIQSSFGSALSGLGDGMKGAAGSGDAKEIFASKPQLTLFALAILIALLIPYISVPFGGGITLFGFASSGARMSSAGGGIGILGILAYLFWLIPIGAGVGIFLDLTGKRDKRIELAVGGICIFALVYYFLLTSAISAQAGPFGAMATSFLSLGFGAYLIVAVGVGLVLTGLGKFNRVPGM